MAFPSINGTPSAGVVAGATSTASVPLPAGVVAGELLLAVMHVANNGWPTPPGWTHALDDAERVSGSTTVLWVLSRVATADADDALIINRAGASGGFAYVVHRLGGVAGGTAGVAANTAVTNDGGLPNPPAVSAPAGAADNLFVVTTPSATTFSDVVPPTGYGGLLSQSGAGWVPTLHVAYRALAAASDDPGRWAWTTGNAGSYWTSTIAVQGTATPADSVAPPTPTNVTAAGGTQTCSGAATTGEPGGTLYWVFADPANPPTKEQVAQGLNGLGQPAARAGNQPNLPAS